MNKFNYDQTINHDYVEALEKIVNAVAHIGVDFGYGVYELELEHIHSAKGLIEGQNQ